MLYRISRTGWKLTVVIHNLKGYDGHLIVKALKSEFGKIRVIPQNMEKYLPLTVGRLKFIDSFQFTPQGLDKLAKMTNLGTCVNHTPLIISDLFVVKVSILMIIWIVLIHLKRLNCHLRMRSLANCLVVHAQIQSTHSSVRRLHIITIPTCSWMCCFEQTFLKSSVRLVCNSIALIHYITTPLLVLHGMLLFACHVSIYSS